MSFPPPPRGPFQPPHAGGPEPYPAQASQQPPWLQQQPWPAAPPPPKRGNGWKWVLGAVALLAVIGVTAAVTLSVSGNGSGGDDSPTAPPTTGSSTGIASADDTGPIAVITEDPSCAPQGPIQETLAGQQRNGWVDRDPSLPAAVWSAEQRAQHEAMGRAMRVAADQMVALAKLTPHRVMRELYEQFIGYSRAYADSIPTYTPADNNLALVSVAAGDAISNICAAIGHGSAAARGPLVSPIDVPSQVVPLGDVEQPQRFLTEPNPICGEWSVALTQFHNDSTAWLAVPSEIPASQWTPEQRATNEAVVPVMRRLASQLQALGARSGNPTLRDFADLSAQYRRAYAEALPTYTPVDNYLATAALRLGGVVKAACQAVGE